MVWEGMEQIELGALVNYIQTANTNDYSANITSFATRGYDAIVTVGFALASATTRAAQQYPHIYIIGIDQYMSLSQPNLVGLIFQEDQAGFLAGALAAMMTTTGTIAGVYGPDIPQVMRFHDGFTNGALYLNPISPSSPLIIPTRITPLPTLVGVHPELEPPSGTVPMSFLALAG